MWAFALLQPPAGFCVTNTCVCVCASAEAGEAFLLGLIQLIWAHQTIFIVVCFDTWLQMQNRNQKIWSGNFYTFQNGVEITGPNIDINKIAQAGKDLDMILGFKSVNP